MTIPVLTAILGAVAVAALLGAFAHLPPVVSFFICAPSVILFPGIVICALLLPNKTEDYTFPEQLGISFVCGLAPLTVLCFVGIVFKLTIGSLASAYAVFCTALLVLTIAYRAARGRGTAGLCGRSANKVTTIVLLAAAVALALATLWSPRDMDDWFYLAYISDYVEGQHINAADALMGPDFPSPPRVWLGAWWVAEALLSSISGAHPVACHQVYVPLMIFPFAILGVFAFARRVFDSKGAACLACFLQVLFYLSSAYPSDTAGWALFARTAQDKSFAFLVPVAFAASFGLAIIRRSGESKPAPPWRLYALYSLTIITAGLVHPMGLVWSAIILIPLACVEFVLKRRQMAAVLLILLILPFLVCGLMLRPGAGAVSLLEEMEPAGAGGDGEASPLFSPYFPGGPARIHAGDRILHLDEDTYIAHPLLITRYPLAMLGLVLTLACLRWWRGSRAARFLVVLTASVLLLAYVPGIAGLTAGLISRKMLYRLTWLLPCGFAIAFFLTSLGLRLRSGYVIALGLLLLLCRGNPANYFSLMAQTHRSNRPDPDLVQAAHALASEPAPRGVVLSTANTGLMMAAYVSEAYPAFVSPAYSSVYRSARVRTPEEIRKVIALGTIDRDFRDLLREIKCRYVLIRMTRSLARSLESRPAEFRRVYANKVYGLWEVPPPEAARN